jgi:SAM-dependent methyltransferase
MAPHPEISTALQEDEQARLNAARWEQGEFVELYANRELREVESAIISRHASDLSGRVLELGCGAGRLTGHLIEVAQEVHGIDLSPTMVGYCRRAYPRGTFSVGDLCDLSGFASGSYQAVVAPFNVLDVLGDTARRGVLDEVHRLLAVDGLFVLSSHNREYARRISTALRLWLRLAVGSPRRPLSSIRNLPRRLSNRRRLHRMERVEDDYAVLNDEAHDFSVLHYYISRDAQERQLSEHGFALLECLDLDGLAVVPGETAAHSSELHYVARR